MRALKASGSASRASSPKKLKLSFLGLGFEAVEGDAATGNEAMDVGMMGQRLSPGVQHGDQADPGAEAFGGKDGERLRRGAHQQAIDGPLVLKGDLGRRR